MDFKLSTNPRFNLEKFYGKYPYTILNLMTEDMQYHLVDVMSTVEAPKGGIFSIL